MTAQPKINAGYPFLGRISWLAHESMAADWVAPQDLVKGGSITETVGVVVNATEDGQRLIIVSSYDPATGRSKEAIRIPFLSIKKIEILEMTKEAKVDWIPQS